MNKFEIFMIIWLLFWGFMIIRVSQVSKFRGKLLNQVSEACDSDIRQRKEWMWRYKIYESVEFDSMVWKFWKPLKSFYPDYKFIEK